MKEKIYRWVFNYLYEHSESVRGLFDGLNAEIVTLSSNLTELKNQLVEIQSKKTCECAVANPEAIVSSVETVEKRSKRKYNRKKKNDDKA